uniref:UDP-glucuronosyltransferase n=1 Tax=Culicoides sonorensis TaxID=179676 RepID=A0A336KL35_CULSO
MKIISSFTILLTVLHLCVSVNSANILGIYTQDIKSHYLIAQNLLRELANSGHNVTVFTVFKTQNLPQNYKEITLNLPSLDEFKKEMAKDGSAFNLIYQGQIFIGRSKNSTKEVVLHEKMQHFLKSKNSIDVILMGFSESPILFGLSKELNAPIIVTSPQPLCYVFEPYTGAYAHDSFVPNLLLNLNDKMNFKERCLNTAVNFIARVSMRLMYWVQRDLLNELYPNSNYNLWEMIQNSVQLMLINSHFTINRPLPYMTNMIEVAGLHIPDQINTLPFSLKKFMDEAENGVIYFCMGATLKMKDLDLEKKLLIVNALKKISMRVVIKWDDDSTINELTPGTKFYASNWLPQNDILAHPNLRAYITHGGILSTTEGIYHGVPIVGIPIFGDQRKNIKKIIEFGIAVQVEYDTLSVETLSEAISRVTQNKTFDTNAKELSKRFRDRPMTPVKTAQYWVEYVIRYKNQDFMRSPAMNLNMIEYFNCDVNFTFLIIILIGSYINWKIFKWSVKKLIGIFKKKSKSQNPKIKKS